MTTRGDSYGAHVTARARQIEGEHRGVQSLKIAVLGPRLDVPCDPSGLKRQQIYDALAEDGHNPFFPESLVSPDLPGETIIEQEVKILSHPDVDLVIILHTDTSFGALMEIGSFARVPDIRRKTGLLFPIKYYTPNTALPGNTVRAYLVRTLYTPEHFDACQLAGECRKWAHDRVSQDWPGVFPHEF